MPPAAPPEYCFLWIDHWSTCMQKGEWSGWAQAIVSTLAVIAGAAGIWWQVRNGARLQREQMQQQEVMLLRIVGQFVFEVRAKLRLIEEEDIPHLHRSWTSIEAPIASIRAVAFDRYPVERVAFAIASGLLSYSFMRDAYARLESDLGSEQQATHIDRSRQHTVAQFFKAEKEIEAALNVRRSRLPRVQIDFGDGIAMRTLEEEPVLVV